MLLSARSEANLAGVHPDLQAVVRKAADLTAFHVTEGVRSLERQRELVKAGKSQTMNSRHLHGLAVDLVAVDDDGSVSYDMADMTRVAHAMRSAAADLGTPLEWGAAAKYGGDFKTFNDSPHFQLPRSHYPDHVMTMPPRTPVLRPPGPKEEAARASWTIFGGLVGVLGGLVQAMGDTLNAIAGQVAEWAPASGLLATWGVSPVSVGLGLSVAGGLLVISRRLNAADKGKIG